MADICVIGGGPSGSTFAARMAQLGHDVCLVERTPFPRSRLGESLSPGVLPLLEPTGARRAIEDCRFRQVRRVLVQWHEGPQVREDPREQGLLVDRGRFDQVLLERAKALGVRVLQPAVIRARERSSRGWRLKIEAGGGTSEVRADFVADASGRSAGVSSRQRPTGCRTVALYAYWRGAMLPEYPRIEAGTDAWYWGVPLPDGSYNTLVFADVKHFRRAASATLAERFHKLLERSGLMAGCRDATIAGKILAADATPYLADETVTPHNIKVGEAALAIDPISSSGVQKAIQSALSGAIVANTLLRRPASSDAALRFYRASLLDASERHRRWAAGHYAAVAAGRLTAFWTARAAEDALQADPSVRNSPDPRALAHTRVTLSRESEFVQVPCLDEAFVTVKSALQHPALDAPVAYLGGFELVPLLQSLREGLTPFEIARVWSTRIPSRSALAIAAWLIENRVLVQESIEAAAETIA